MMLPRIFSVLVAALTVLLVDHGGLASAAPGGVVQFHHIHGLAVDPKDPNVLFVATHGGLLRVIQDRQWEWVGEARHDYMGFTHHPREQGTVFVSGHPQGGALPNPMGLLVSRTGGRTWQPLALRGQVDFHAMTISADGGILYGWNVMGSPGLYRVSAKDGAWTRVDAAGLRDVLSLAAHPREPESLLAGTRSGLLVSRDGGTIWTSVAPRLEGVPVTAVAYAPKDPNRLYA
ncbi:MAG: F510_1955 family glycosylhydrolase, partial [Candidatus Methylomirabilales bacterium]